MDGFKREVDATISPWFDSQPQVLVALRFSFSLAFSFDSVVG